MSFKNKLNVNYKKNINKKSTLLEEELYELYIDISSILSNKKNNKYINLNIKKINSKIIINSIKDIIITYIKENIEEKKQMRNIIIKLENDIKIYLKEIFSKEIEKEIHINKINKYIKIEEEYEILKEKVKYKKGKFLNDDKKDNEIFILRQENSNLKNEINKLDLIIKENNEKIKNMKKKIKKIDYNIQYNTLNNKNINIRIIDSPYKTTMNTMSNNHIINNNIIINEHKNKLNKNKTNANSTKNFLNTSYNQNNKFIKRVSNNILKIREKDKINELNKTTNLFHKIKDKNRVLKNF